MISIKLKSPNHDQIERMTQPGELLLLAAGPFRAMDLAIFYTFQAPDAVTAIQYSYRTVTAVL